MELDQLKYQLNRKLETAHLNKSAEDIAALLKKRTRSVVQKLKGSVRFELICALVFLFAMGYVAVTTRFWALKIYFGVFSILCAVFAVFLAYLLQRINQLGNTILPVKSNLERLQLIVKEFVKRYFQFSMALLPICFVFSVLLSHTEPIRIPQVEKMASRIFSAPWQLWMFLIGYMISLAIFVYFFTKWYLKKLYGNYLAELGKCICELEEQPA